MYQTHQKRKSKKRIILKSISPLVAAVLLIAFTMAVGALITAWVTNITKGGQEKIQEGQKKIECSYASIDIRDEFSRINASYEGNSVIMEVYVVNNGLNPISLKEIQVYDRSGRGSRIYKFSQPISLEKDESKYIDINITLPYKELGLQSEEDIDKVRFYTECEGITAIATKPYGGWQGFDTPITSIVDVIPVV